MNEQDRSNIEIARKMYEGDESERASVASDIIWHPPGHNPVSRDYHGYEEYTKLMSSLMAPLTRWEFTLESVMTNRNLVMTTYHLQGERKGKIVDLHGGHLMRIENGKVVEGWGFTDDQDALDEFFSA
ncbi:MAG: nuclear transport factor 2 family protein [Anaerolineales bacterium]|nr:nuclear transport factor 2 family protein [Anaerolineales bacterium]